MGFRAVGSTVVGISTEPLGLGVTVSDVKRGDRQ